MNHLKVIVKVIVCALIGLTTGLFTMGCEQVDASLAFVGLADDRDPAWVAASAAYEKAADAVTDASESTMDTQHDIIATRVKLDELEARYKTDSDTLSEAVAAENAAWEAAAVEAARIRAEHSARLKDTEAKIDATDKAVIDTAADFSDTVKERVTE